MSDTQWRRVDEIEFYKQKTFNLSRTDRIGRLITKSFDLIQTIIRDGPNAETLIYDVESLKTEQVNAMNCDPNQSDLFRSILYDLSSSIGSMIESIQERNEPENYLQETFTDTTAEFTGDSSTYQSYMSETIKEEPVEFQEDRPFTKIDEKPCDNFGQNAEDVIVVEKTAMEHTASTEVSAGSDSNQAKDSREISQSNPKRPRMVIIPKEDDSEEDAEYGAERPVMPSTPTTPSEGNFNCDRCERQFNNSSALKRHKIIHQGTRCGDCGKRLMNKNNLHRHYAEFHPGKRAKAAKVKSTPKALKCTQCGYTAAQYSNLVNHMRTHTGEKPFFCRECNGTFTENGALYRHLRAVHNLKPFKCEDCGMQFGRQAELFDHKKMEHIK